MKLDIMKNKLAIPLAAAALMISAGTGFVAVANADTLPSNSTTDAGQKHEKPAAMGEITAIDGNTITISDKRENTTYTVGASSATITKHEKPAAQGEKPTETTISVSDLVVGDMIAVRGTVSGTNVTATTIETGMRGGPGGFGMHGRGVMGTVSSVDGSTITVSGKDGTTYTVNAGSATAHKVQTISVSDIQVGDTIGVEGSVSGTTVTANHIMDGVPEAPTTTTGQ